MRRVQIAPSLLAADFSRLGAEVALIEPFADLLHLDVMDHFHDAFHDLIGIEHMRAGFHQFGD